MTRNPRLPITLVLLGLWLPVWVGAQSDPIFVQSDQTGQSLGDLARSLRKSKAPPVHTVIDNDNLSQVMDEAEGQRLKGRVRFSFDAVGKSFQVSSPDVTCSLSFNAQATSLLSDPYVPQDLPESELLKLDGPATIDFREKLGAVLGDQDWHWAIVHAKGVPPR